MKCRPSVAEAFGVDSAVVQERRQHDRRAPDHLPVHHYEAAGEALAVTLQKDLGEKEVRGRAADIDADGLELDVLLAPNESGERFSLLCRHRFAKVLVLEVAVVHIFVFITHLFTDMIETRHD